MKSFFAIFAVAACALTLSAADLKPTDTRATIKIGVILPLTGNNSQVGEPQLRAVKLFEQELNTNQYKHKYKVIVEDDQFIPRITMEAATKLLSWDKVDALITFGIAPGRALAPKAAQLGIPMICVNASYPEIADGKTNFLHCPPVEEETSKMVDVLQKLGSKRIAFLSVRNPGIISVIDRVKVGARKQGMEIVSDVEFNPDERDFRTTMGLIRETKPDTFIPTALSPEIDIIFNQRKQAGLMPQHILAYEVFNFMQDKKEIEGCYYVSPSIGTPEFQARLKASTGQESFYCVPYIYDSLNLIRNACEDQATVDHSKTCDYLRSLKDYPAAVGRISMDSHGIIHSPISIFQIRNSKPVEVKLEDVK